MCGKVAEREKLRPVMTPERGWMLVIFWVTGAACVWLFAAVWPDLNAWLRTEQHLSGWAEGVGSILAIYAAVRLAASQVRADRLLERDLRIDDDIRVVAAIDAVLEQIEYSASIVAKELADRDAPVLFAAGAYAQMLEDAAKRLESVNLFDVPDEKLITLIGVLPRQARDAARAVTTYDDTCHKGGLKAVQDLMGSTFNGASLLLSITKGARRRCAEFNNQLKELRST